MSFVLILMGVGLVLLLVLAGIRLLLFLGLLFVALVGRAFLAVGVACWQSLRVVFFAPISNERRVDRLISVLLLGLCLLAVFAIRVTHPAIFSDPAYPGAHRPAAIAMCVSILAAQAAFLRLALGLARDFGGAILARLSSPQG